MLNVLKGKVFNKNMQKSINIYDKIYIHNDVKVNSKYHVDLNLSLRIALSIAFLHAAHDLFLSSIGNFLKVVSLIRSMRGSLSSDFFSYAPEQLQSLSSSLSKTANTSCFA